ncbi:hypothetical protein D3C84_657430 [compost metagenome]
MGQSQSRILNFLVFYLSLTDVPVHDGQFLLQGGDDQQLAAMLFGRGSEVFCGFLRVDTSCFFAVDIAPRHGLCVSGSRPSFSLPCAGYLFLRLLANFLQASAQALPFIVELQLIRHPVRHVGNVAFHQAFSVSQLLQAIQLLIQPENLMIERVDL